MSTTSPSSDESASARANTAHERAGRAVGPTVLSARALRKEVASGERTLTILEGLSLDVGRGESVAILGSSGAGKSTLLSLLAGLDTPSGGELDMFGQSLGALDEDGRARLRAGRVGFVFQNFQLLPTLTALENVLLPQELTDAGMNSSRGHAWLARVGLAERMHHLPKQLSGGEQQRVAIARAFVTEPELVFADEPTGNLDRDTGKRIADLLFSINREAGTTLVLVTHDLSLASRCDRQLTLEHGCLHARASSEAGL